jgi:glycosyltransferase involved in cell wall biosynthesis
MATPLSSQVRDHGHGPLRVCVIGSTYPRYHDDPLVPWLRESVGRLARRGHHMTVVVPSFEGLASHSIDGVVVQRFRYAARRMENLTHDEGAPNKVRKNPLYKLLGVPYIVSGAAHLAYWAARARFDVLHVHWPFPHALLPSLAVTLRGLPRIATCHGAELALAQRSPTIRRVLRRSLLDAHVLSCNSSHTRRQVERLCGRVPAVVPYGSTVLPTEGRGPARSPGEPAVLLFSGRLIQRKGVDVLIRALPRILQSRAVRLVLTGEGDRREQWERLAVSLGVREQVQFVGFVTTERLRQLYRTCDVYVHPAVIDDAGDTEGLGVVLVEALASRCPVVASDVGGIVDVIRHEETGLLVPEKNPEALAASILRVLGDRQLARRLGEAGRAFAVKHFDWERITDATEDLYYEALERARPVPVRLQQGA